MTAEIEVLVSEKKDVRHVPVQCVVERGGKFRAYVKTPRGVEVRDLALGGTNDTVLEVVDGLKEGELVLLSPRADMPDAGDRIADLDAIDAIDVNKRYGASHAKSAAAAPAAGPGKAVAPGKPAQAPAGG
jgi:HlyD family secretion protein